MAEVKVLIEGYAHETDEGWQASSSAVLVEDSDRKILVEPKRLAGAFEKKEA